MSGPSNRNTFGLMIDHIGLSVSDYEAAKAFYSAVLAPLGAAKIMEVPPDVNPSGWACGFGRDGKPDFWIGSEGKTAPPQHVAFKAHTRAEVRAFYEAALKAGAKDNGPPGIRAHYHPSYYGAFVRDPDGHNIEAVCHAPTE